MAQTRGSRQVRRGVDYGHSGRRGSKESAFSPVSSHAAETHGDGSAPNSAGDGVNILSSRHSIVDQRIDLLLKALSETLATEPRRQVSDALSGGRTQTRTKRGTGLRSTTRDLAETRSRILDTIAAAEYLGCDIMDIKRQLTNGIKQQDHRQFEKSCAEMNGTISKALPAAIKDLSESIHHLERLGLEMSHEKSLLGSSVRSFRGRDYHKALSNLAECKKRLREDELKPAIKAILRARKGLVAARRNGCDVGTATALLKQSITRLKAKDAAEAEELAKRALRTAQEPLELRRNAQELVRACTRSVAVAKGLGMTVEGASDMASQSHKLFSTGNFTLAAECAKKAIALATVHTSNQIGALIDLAEMNLALARTSDIPTAGAETSLGKARDSLSRNEFAISLEMACASLLESNTAIAGDLQKRAKQYNEFAGEMATEIESFKQVQEAIEHTKLRSLETVRKYAGLSEEIVNQAYENASAYARVTQDIMGHACESATGLAGNGYQAGEGSASLGAGPSVLGKVMSISRGDRKLRIIDSFLSGKITSAELDKLLDLVDSDHARLEVVPL